MVAGDAPIVVGVDGSDSSVAALQRAAAIGEAVGRPVVAVTSWVLPPIFHGYYPTDWSPEGDAELASSDAVERAFGGRPPAFLTRELREGGAAHVLVEASTDAYMLVVGSRGHSGVAGLLLGSVSSACAERAHCPVLIMHGAGPAAG
jgi:nucleotide-binding universal stress UspA family protein